MEDSSSAPKKEDKSESKIINKREYPKKKYLDLEADKKDFETCSHILTNLTRLDLNPKAIKDVYLYGCDIEEENRPSHDFNPVSIMRKARKIKCFQEQIKKYIPNYYISGLVLMGRPNKDKKKIKFYLKIGENNEILKELPENPESETDKIYKFKFKRKEGDLSKMNDGENIGDVQCVANYLNICLGKILKKCGYTKDRSSRKILYYNKQDVHNARYLKNKEFLYFSALKAVCETYDQGKIYMKLLPKKLLKTNSTYADVFYSIESNDINEVLSIFKGKVVGKRGIKVYDQAFIKIEDVIFENPYNLEFFDKNNKKWTVGDYYTNSLKIPLHDEKIPIAVRIIDKGGKLKEKDRLYIHIPCFLLEIIGNIFGSQIDIKDLVQSPYEKYDEIHYIRDLIEKNASNSNDDELHNYLGNKFDPVTINGQVILPPIIQFDNNFQSEVINGSFDLLGSSPYSKTKELNKVDIYLLDLDKMSGETIWGKLCDASKELGISFKMPPTFYPIDDYPDHTTFEKYIDDYFSKVDQYYNDKKNVTDFIFMFMDSRKKSKFHYKVFKSIINKFNWSIPTQVILYDSRKLQRTNLSQFTNILCQMWAKKGNELYICDFSFIPKTMVVAYSSTELGKNVLTSISVSIGTKLYEYMFYSSIEENKTNDRKISPSIESLLSKALITVGKHLKKSINNIVIYRDAVNEKQMKLVQQYEIDYIKKAIEKANKELDKKIFSETKWCLILVSKINEIKMFLESYNRGNNNNPIENIPVGTLVDRLITSNDKYDFYLNSAESRQGTCSSTHYTVLYDDSELTAIQIYKLTYYLTYLSYNTTKSIRVPAPLYFVTRRNKFTVESLGGVIINPKFRTLNISL